MNYDNIIRSKFALWLSFLLILITSSCDTAIQPNSLDEWVRSNDHKSIKAHFYKKSRIEDEKIQKVVQMYSDSINAQNLEARPIVDKSFKKLVSGKEMIQ